MSVPRLQFYEAMDWLDWIMYGAGGAFGLLTLRLGFSRISGFAERDVEPIWLLAFVVLGAVLLASLVTDWAFPIRLTVYLVNGGEVRQQVMLGDQVVCLPPKSYDDFVWRFGGPDRVIVGAGGGGGRPPLRFPIGKGTWFINTSPETVTADMYDRSSDSVDFGSVSAQVGNGPFRISTRYGRPFRMFSQSSLERAYQREGDIKHASSDGPCAN